MSFKSKMKFGFASAAVLSALALAVNADASADADELDVLVGSSATIAEYSGTITETQAEAIQGQWDAPFKNETPANFSNDEYEEVHLNVADHVTEFEFNRVIGGSPSNGAGIWESSREDMLAKQAEGDTKSSYNLVWHFQLSSGYNDEGDASMLSGSTLFVQLPEWVDIDKLLEEPIRYDPDWSTDGAPETYITETGEFGIRFNEDVFAYNWRGYLSMWVNYDEVYLPPFWTDPNDLIPLWPTMPPVEPEVPEDPNTPEDPEVPEDLTTQEKPNTPEEPVIPSVPENPEIPAEPDTPAVPELPVYSTPVVTSLSVVPALTVTEKAADPDKVLPDTSDSKSGLSMITGLLTLSVAGLVTKFRKKKSSL